MIIKTFNLFKYILRHLNFIKLNIKINPKINFGSLNSNTYFYKSLKKCNFYLEYGSGSSSLLAIKLKKKFISIETDKSFHNLICDLVPVKYNKNINYLNYGPTKYDALPILPVYFIKKQIYNYAFFIENSGNSKKIFPDLVLVDGRFRVMVCLSILYLQLKNNVKSKIILDDYKDRNYYKVLKKYFDIKLVGRLAILNKKNKKYNILKIENLINKYLYDPR